MFQCSYRDAKSSFHLPKNHSKTRENIKCILGISAMISLDTIAHYSYENSYLLLFSRIIWLCQQSEASDLLCESIGKKKSWILMPVVSCSGPWWPCTGLWGGGGSRESEWRCRLNAIIAWELTVQRQSWAWCGLMPSDIGIQRHCQVQEQSTVKCREGRSSEVTSTRVSDEIS